MTERKELLLYKALTSVRMEERIKIAKELIDNELEVNVKKYKGRKVILRKHYRVKAKLLESENLMEILKNET